MERRGEEAAMLIAQSGLLNGQRWSINKTLLIGRDTSCDIIIADRQVSRHHARLQKSSNGILLEDLGSKNGTTCNGSQITDTVLLQDGDVIQIALAQRFIYISSDATLPLESPLYVDQFSQPSEIQPPSSPQSFPKRLRLDKRSRRVFINVREGQNWIEREIVPPISVSQFHILEMLYENEGRVVSRYDLITAVWGEEQALEVSVQALDAMVRRLRERLASIDPEHKFIITVRGHGLRLENHLLTEFDQ